VRPFDLTIRNATYACFVELGRAPARADIAALLDVAERTVDDAWERLHDEHAIVLDSAGRLLMANPFSAVPTPFRVTADGRRWNANCAWDAIGISAALQCDGEIETTCADCDEPIGLAIADATPSDDSLLFHCLVPANRWWNDIAFT